MMDNLEDMIKKVMRIPDFSEFKRPLFVGPHPDDIEFGCGGLISKYKEMGIKPVYVIVTEGGAGSNDPSVTPEMLACMRQKESIESAKYMGVDQIEFLGFPDGGKYSIDDVIEKIAPIVLKYNPDVIFSPDSKLRSECHPDHIKTGEAVRKLTQLISHPESLRRNGIDVNGIENFPDNIYLSFYFTDEPNTAVAISKKNLDDKLASLMLHKSQMQGSEGQMLLAYFSYKAEKLGQKSGLGLAEDYQVLVPLAQHVYSEGLQYEI